MPALDVLAEVEALLTDLAVHVVNLVASRRRVLAADLAKGVSGLCHTHAPDRRLHHDCAYCLRRGNCFAA